MPFMPTRAQGRTHRLPGLTTADNEWLRSVRRETWFRLRVRTTRWPLAGDSRCVVAAAAVVFDDRLRLAARDAEGIRPANAGW
jgi:hypothetical protein